MYKLNTRTLLCQVLPYLGMTENLVLLNVINIGAEQPMHIVSTGRKLKELTCLLRHIATEEWGLLIHGMHYLKHYVKKSSVH